ncbi:hypothetical protein [Nocardioides sp.]|uniref:hypothetical protein n=1 Tax=Nocardioides sp. TaxID=35761 RepID=UPI00260632BC|nr:hypothetical protein [Nocardioides sp.]
MVVLLAVLVSFLLLPPFLVAEVVLLLLLIHELADAVRRGVVPVRTLGTTPGQRLRTRQR